MNGAKLVLYASQVVLLAHQPLNESMPSKVRRSPITAMSFPLLAALSSPLFLWFSVVFPYSVFIWSFDRSWMCIYAREGGET